jgi:hypothetical protein
LAGYDLMCRQRLGLGHPALSDNLSHPVRLTLCRIVRLGDGQMVRRRPRGALLDDVRQLVR